MSDLQATLEALNRRLLGTKYDSLDDYWQSCIAKYLLPLGVEAFGIYVLNGDAIEYRQHGLDGFDIRDIKSRFTGDIDRIEFESGSLSVVGLNSENIKWVVLVVEKKSFTILQPIINNFEIPLLEND